MNKTVLFSALGLVAMCIIFSLNQVLIMLGIRYLLESGYLMGACTIFVFVSIICHGVYVNESVLEDVPMFKSNQLWILEILVNIATYVAITSTAITLLKALYIQQFYGDIQYFLEFKSYDIYTMFGVSCALLWFSMFKCWLLFHEALNSHGSAVVEKA
ncbi:hypothetical protein AKG98_863 [Moritella sp. JT01]|uniref:hypothetical protein n=1 Tax=Moritella sp. JT01 TaxID=756698 RepID=UPI0007928C6F|nr:hypothetical protein [Moritella sp. JT01]KXO10079.1 hypothetical protein AKG98_863 [Moritella sp. JT01]